MATSEPHESETRCLAASRSTAAITIIQEIKQKQRKEVKGSNSSEQTNETSRET